LKQPVGVTEQTNLCPHRVTIEAQVTIQNARITAIDRQKSGAGAQQRCLTRTIGALEQNDFAGRHRKSCSSYCRKVLVDNYNIGELNHIAVCDTGCNIVRCAQNLT
jgi:hypothetical protein